MKLEFDSGRLVLHYSGQINPQDTVADIEANGTVYVHADPEIGGGVPSNVWHGVVQRIQLHYITAKGDARAWYREARPLLARLIAGMGDEWDGSNRVGTLTDDARAALDAVCYRS
jgi:hypothetical protein